MLKSVGFIVLGALLVFNTQDDSLITSIGFSLLGGTITYNLIPIMGPLFISKGFSGKDLSKVDKPVIPETMGAVSSLVYLFCMYFFVPFMFYKYLVTDTSGGGNRDTGVEEEQTGSLNYIFPHNKLAEYLSAILSLQSMLILGVADDIFDIRWRNKFFMPAIAAIPLLIVYYVDFGVTKVVIPPFLGLGESVDLGFLYYGYMCAVAIFCPNSINIYAGVNGLEVGQVVSMAICVIVNDLYYIFWFPIDHPARESHLFSMYLLVPLLGVSVGLLMRNWFPAQAFVGDTFCYFSGMVFAVVGILGHFSKTLLMFFIPQIFNFVYSVPQLFKIVDCPRHRLPKLNPETGLLEPSRAEIKPSKRKPLVVAALKLLAKLGLVGLWIDEKNDKFEISNLTLINLVLVRLGPMREDHLCTVLMLIQVAVGIASIIVRHWAAALLFGRDNL